MIILTEPPKHRRATKVAFSLHEVWEEAIWGGCFQLTFIEHLLCASPQVNTLSPLIKILSWRLSHIKAVNKETLWASNLSLLWSPAGCQDDMATPEDREGGFLPSSPSGWKSSPQGPRSISLTLLAQRQQCRQHLPVQVLHRRHDGVQHRRSPAGLVLGPRQGLFLFLYMEFIQKWFSHPPIPSPQNFGCALKITKSWFFFFFFRKRSFSPSFPPCAGSPWVAPTAGTPRAVLHQYANPSPRGHREAQWEGERESRAGKETKGG